jgi:hypothetical protein
LILALGAVSCGGDDDDSSGAADRGQATGTSTTGSEGGSSDDGAQSRDDDGSGETSDSADDSGSSSGGTIGDDAGSSSSDEERDTTARRRKQRQSEERRARALLVRLYRDLRNSDVGGVCDALTPAGRAAVGQSSPKKGENCEQAMARFYAFGERDNEKLRRSLRTRVLGATVRGDRAVVQVRFPGSSAARGVELVKFRGAWKLPSTPVSGG